MPPAHHNRAVNKRDGRLGRSGHAVAISALLACASLAVACQHRPMADPSAAGPSFELHVPLSPVDVSRYRAADLWIARPLGDRHKPLVLHLSGDSGRHGLDLLLFTAMTRWGYPVAIASSPSWAATLVDRMTTPQALARDLDRLSRAAARAAGLPEDQPFVLLGQSRGAGLSVEAASDPLLRERLRGIVALGLCPLEERIHRNGRAGRPYRDKALLDDLPLEVIQSTHDQFLSAAAARRAFGPDTERQRFHPIEARSHTFVGNREALLEQLRDSLDRVSEPRHSPSPAEAP